MTLALYSAILARLHRPRATRDWLASFWGNRRANADRYEADPALAGLPAVLRPALPCQACSGTGTFTGVVEISAQELAARGRGAGAWADEQRGALIERCTGTVEERLLTPDFSDWARIHMVSRLEVKGGCRACNRTGRSGSGTRRC